MKILHVNTQKGFRGGEQQLLWLAEGLNKKGVVTAVACIEDELYKRCKERGIQTVKLSKNRLISVFELAKASKNFDMVHAHASHAHTISAFSRIISKKPLIYTKRTLFPPNNNPATIFKYKNTEKVVCIAKSICSNLDSFVDNKKTEVIYSAIDLKVEKRVDEQRVKEIKKPFKEKKIIGSVAALTKEKNLPNFIKAAEILLKKNKDFVFLVIGEGNERKDLGDLIRKLNIENNFKLLGFKNGVENYIKAFDLFVLSSNYEGLGSSILTAMLLKVPVVATNVGGIPEIVIHEKTGLLVEKDNPKKLAEAIERLLKDRNLINRLTKNAYKMVRENFSVEKMVEKYLKIYKELMEE